MRDELGHVLAAKVQLGGECVVGGAVQGQVFGGVRTALSKRMQVMKLALLRLAAAFAALVDVPIAKRA